MCFGPAKFGEPDSAKERVGKSADAAGTSARATIGTSVRKLWQPVRDLLARRIRYKITRGGLLFTFAIAMVAFGAMVSANNLLFLIVATMMATLLILGLVS